MATDKFFASVALVLGSLLFLSTAPSVFAASETKSNDPLIQPLKSRLWEKAKLGKHWQGPDFLLVYPEKGAAIQADRIRFAGATDPDATVRINEKPVQVFPSGAFAGLLTLQEGENTFTFTASSDSGSTTTQVTVIRKPDPKTLPSYPLEFDPDVPVEPQESVVMRPGDILRVQCKASAGQAVCFRIGRGRVKYAMPEKPLSKTNQVGGIYEGSYIVQPLDRFHDATIVVFLSDKDPKRKAETISKEAKGRFTVERLEQPRVIQVEEEYTPLYTTPKGRARLGNVPEGVRMSAVGLMGDRIRVRLAKDLFAWVPKSDVSPLPEGTPPPRSAISSLGTTTGDEGTTVSIALAERLPFSVRQTLTPPLLELTIYGANSNTWWVTNRHDDRVISQLQWTQPEEEVYTLKIFLKNSRQWGYTIGYVDNTLYLFIKNCPHLAAAPASPVKDLVIAIDPGHGGEELGAVGSTGLYEKDVNLHLSYHLKELLEANGARVILTRSDDRDVDLIDRVKIAVDAGADILISMHNNSIGSSVDPLRPKGTSTYYYHPQSIELSRDIYDKLLEITPPLHPFGNVELDFAVIRHAHQMPAVLVEGLFMSHPADEMMLMDEEFHHAFTQAIYDGLVTYLDKQRPPHPESEVIAEE
jgi:N-acetylmuramoyl-L-alanine amidase